MNKLTSFKTKNKPGTLHCLNDLNFNTKRIFYIDNFEEKLLVNNNKRGLHANINFNEILIILEGEIQITLIDKNCYKIIKNIKKNDYIFIPKMNWIEFSILNNDTIILVLADEIMSKSISIHNYDDFKLY